MAKQRPLKLAASGTMWNMNQSPTQLAPI